MTQKKPSEEAESEQRPQKANDQQAQNDQGSFTLLSNVLVSLCQLVGQHDHRLVMLN